MIKSDKTMALKGCISIKYTITMSCGHEEQIEMSLDAFIDEIESAYQYATDRGFDSIVIAIDTDLSNTYYINNIKEGFQCDLFDYVFDDLYDISSQLYNELHGNVVDIRIE